MRVSINPDYLTDIAEAIRSRNNGSKKYKLTEMAAAIRNTPTYSYRLSVKSYESIENLPNGQEPEIGIQSTTKVGRIFLRQTAPENPNEGDVYIFDGNPTVLAEYDYSIAPVRDLDLTIYPQQVKQYEGGVWVDKNFKVFKNGEWKFPINPKEENKWDWKKYASQSATYPTPDILKNLTPTQHNFYADRTSYINVADSYTAIATCYVFVEADVSVDASIKSDDNGSLTINDVLVSNTTTTARNATLSFKKGWNKVEFCYTEGPGDDGWVISPMLSATSAIKKMYASI